MKRIVFVFLGSLSLFLGILGIFVPGLPTTPFLLLTATLYVKSSPKLYRYLINNKYLGPYITQYRENGGMTRPQKLSALGLIWLFIPISVIFFIHSNTLRLVVVVAGVVGTLVMGFIVPTAKK